MMRPALGRPCGSLGGWPPHQLHHCIRIDRFAESKSLLFKRNVWTEEIELLLIVRMLVGVGGGLW